MGRQMNITLFCSIAMVWIQHTLSGEDTQFLESMFTLHLYTGINSSSETSNLSRVSFFSIFSSNEAILKCLTIRGIKLTLFDIFQKGLQRILTPSGHAHVLFCVNKPQTLYWQTALLHVTVPLVAQLLLMSSPSIID